MWIRRISSEAETSCERRYNCPRLTSPAGSAIANKPLPGPPKIEDLDNKPWPVMWTTEAGRGRVFVCGVGHNYLTFKDPYFRIILLRAMA
jgi:hypothetical protein